MPSSSEGSGGREATALPLIRGFALLPWVIRPARRAGPTSWSRQARPLPWFWAGGGWLFAAQSRHEKPYPPMSKIKFRLVFERQDGNSMPHSPAQRKRDFGKLKFCALGAEFDERRETIDANEDLKTLDYEVMRLHQCLIVSRLGASLVYRLMSARRFPPRRRRARARYVTYANM